MIDAIYQFLDWIGYLHPIHPAMTHMPIGLVVGALAIGGSALFLGRPDFARCAWHVLVVALFFWLPTVVLGVMDWQRYYAGAWLHPITMKMLLAGILLVLLVTGTLIGYRDPGNTRSLLVIYLLCFMTVTGLGYFGGQLVYANRTPAGPPEYAVGEHTFDSNCSGCHAHGGNTIMPNLPLRSAPQLDRFHDFLNFLRDPKRPNDTRGPMPAFKAGRISDNQAHELYDYITHVIAQPKRE